MFGPPQALPNEAQVRIQAHAATLDERAEPPATAAPSQTTPNEGPSASPLSSRALLREEPLRIGGQIYLRAFTTGRESQRLGRYSFNAPALLDVYLDARPNDRVRGFVLGRTTYDATTRGSDRLTLGGPEWGSEMPSNTPVLAIDQLWLRFDVARTVFVTAGKQHVRWGTGKFWSPTDFFHLRSRDPLELFDTRTGTTMVKLHLPIEDPAWNLYAYGKERWRDLLRTYPRPCGR
jgi:hypothetical protein